MPSMPIGFWGDDDGSRLREAYFEEFPGVWRHGDWCKIISSPRVDGDLRPLGLDPEPRRRADGDVGVLPGGRRGRRASPTPSSWRRGGKLLLFVVLDEGAELDDDLRKRLSTTLRTELSPRHVPDRIEAVPDVPRTLNGKKLEVPVKRLLEGVEVEKAVSTGAVADPEALEPFLAFAREMTASRDGPALSRAGAVRRRPGPRSPSTRSVAARSASFAGSGCRHSTREPEPASTGSSGSSESVSSRSANGLADLDRRGCDGREAVAVARHLPGVVEHARPRRPQTAAHRAQPEPDELLGVGLRIPSAKNAMRPARPRTSRRDRRRPPAARRADHRGLPVRRQVRRATGSPASRSSSSTSRLAVFATQFSSDVSDSSIRSPVASS